MPRDYPRYDITFKRPHDAVVSLDPDTQKRRAIRRLRSMLSLNPPHTKGEVRVTPLGKKRGTLIYQAHTDADGKVVAEEL